METQFRREFNWTSVHDTMGDEVTEENREQRIVVG